MNNYDSNNDKLMEYNDNVDSSINTGNYDGAMIWNDKRYSLLFNLYILAQSKFFRNEYLKDLDMCAKQGILIQDKLIVGFN